MPQRGLYLNGNLIGIGVHKLSWLKSLLAIILHTADNAAAWARQFIYNKVSRIKSHIKDFWRHIWPILGSLFFVVCFYIGLAGFLPFLSFVDFQNAAKAGQAVQEYIQKDEDYLLSVARTISRGQDLYFAIGKNDHSSLDEFGKNQQYKYKIDEILFTDKNGLVLSRSNPSSYYGDYIFQTVPYGRAIAKQDEIKGIAAGAVWPVVIVAGKHFDSGTGQSLGIVLPVYIFNNEYADRFKRYSGNDIAFYSSKSGIIGDSFNNNKITRNITIYFNPSSASFPKPGTESYTKIDGKNYLVWSGAFSDFGDHPGGYLLFVPQTKNGTVLWSVIVTILLFLIFLVLNHLKLFGPTLSMDKSRAIFTAVIVSATIIFPLTLIVVDFSVSQRYAGISEPTHTIYNSLLSISPPFAVFHKTVEQQIKVVVSSGGETINLVQAVIDFDPTMASVADISLDDSFCAKGLLIDRSIDNKKGEVRVACVVMAPGFSGAPMTVANLFIQPKASGNVQFTFGKDSAVLANDGLGTNVLRQATGGSYEISDSSDASASSSIIVFSPTHPNGTRWYNNPEADFIWQGDPGATFMYGIGPTATSSMTIGTTTATEVKIMVGSGLHFFHIHEMVGGKMMPMDVLYPVRIDVFPPERPTVKLSSSSVKTDEIVRAEFSSDDPESGLEKNFYVSYDGGIFLPTVSPLQISFSESGDHSITIRAFDNAGNFSDATAHVTVR